MRKPKYKVDQKVSMEGRDDELFITEVDVPPCSCVEHTDPDGEIHYAINDLLIVKESEISPA